MYQFSNLMKRVLAGLLALAGVLSLVPVSAFAASGSDSLVDGGVYAILAKGGQMAVNVQFAVDNYGYIVLDPYDGQDNELWTVHKVSSDTIYLTPKHQPSSALNVLYGAGAGAGDQVRTYISSNPASDTACLFKVIKNSDGSFSFKNLATNWYVDVNCGYRTTGTRINIWYYDKQTSNQKFDLVLVENPNAVTIEDGASYAFLAKSSSQCVNVLYAETNYGRLGLDPWNEQSNEIWTAHRISGNTFYFTPGHSSSSCMNALYGAGASAGDQVRTYISSNPATDTACHWEVIYNSDGTISLKNLATGYYLDVDNGGRANGTRLNLWYGNNSDNQKFNLKKVASASAWQWPVNNFTISQSFGHYSTAMASSKGRPYHLGVDMTSNGDKNIYAAAGGTVVYKRNDSSNGLHVVIEHTINGKTVYTLYAHLSDYASCPAEGSTVAKGQKIGVMGNTGNSTGEHLHFAIFTKKSSSPYGYGTNAASNSKSTYAGSTFYDPAYVINNGSLPQ